MEELLERCPWCNGLVSRKRFAEIQAKIRLEEHKKLADAEAEMRKRLQAEFMQNLAKTKQAIEIRAKQDADKQLAALVAERNNALSQVKQIKIQEARIREQAKTDSDRKLQALMKQAEQDRQKELAEQRQILEKDRDAALIKKQFELARERERFQKKFMEMERQLQRKTANEIGDGAEIDLFEALREAFPDDRITRIKKGEPGADILQQVMHKGETCGRIVYDSKNRQSWQYVFVTKLREDQLDAEAEHAILSTTVFPSGRKELCIESDVIVVHPARAVCVARLLRQAVLLMHVRGLSIRERSTKTDMLYRFITSDAYRQRFSQVSRLIDDLLELDVEEKRAHDGVWKKRGTLLTRQNNMLRDIDTEVSAIVEGSDESRLPAA
jgi:hypothetical protein